VTTADVILAVGYWDTQTGAPTSAPGSGKYRADSWTAPALVAIANQDANGYDRSAGLAAILAGDLLTELSPTDSRNYQRWNVTAVTPQAGYVLLGVEVAEDGPAFAAPGSNQRRLLEAFSAGSAPPTADPWRPWAPPLNPPTAGGLDEATAEAIAAATWDSDPHLCAALQWEAYAATLPPSPSVAQVSTGAQSVAYSPPMPGGDYGAAMARAAWHRSLMSSIATVPLTQAAPAVSSVGEPWGDTSWPGEWWPVG